MKVSCVTIDDEFLALQILLEYSKKIPALDLVGEFTNPLDALTFLKNHSVDLLLLDIQMPYVNGLELITKLKHPPSIIFTTARHDYAVKAYELDILDYLVKPISFERFNQAVEKAKRMKQLLQAATKGIEGHLLIRADFQIQQIPFSDIIYLEGLSEYVKVYTKAKMHITLGPMKDLLQQLPLSHFVQIHKSYIVRLTAIQSFTHQSVSVGTSDLPLGRTYKSTFLAQVKKTQH